MLVSGWKTQAGMYSRPLSGLLSYLRSHSFPRIKPASAETRSWPEALSRSKELEKDLQALAEGETVNKGVTVGQAVKEWLEFRSKNGLDNTRADLMGRKLTQWCEKNEVFLLTAITTDRAIKFHMSLPFRTGDSSSLSVQWAVISSFFNWCVRAGYIDKSPTPNARQNPQFAIAWLPGRAG
jgi:integrase